MSPSRWSAKSKPLYWPFDWNTHLMGNALALADNEGMKRLTNAACEGYDQHGSMLGEVFIYVVGQVKQQLEINLPGLRQRRWEPTAMGKDIRRHASIISVCGDGMVVHVGAFGASGIKE